MGNYAAQRHDDVTPWLARHPRMTLHLTPTYASLMTLVEAWFGIVERQAIRPRRRHIVNDFNTKIRAFNDG